MTIQKTKLALALTGALFLSLPMSQAFAHDKHCSSEATQLGKTMEQMKDELRAYVKAFRGSNTEVMQQHLNKLLKLGETANQYTPNKIAKMNHSKMGDQKMNDKNMPEMDHSKMGGHKMNDKNMPGMDHSKMGGQKMNDKNMPGMDHSKMGNHKMNDKNMPGMDHSKMGHGNMQMDAPEHDMSAMPSMAGMTPEQHHQHMKYMQGMSKLQDLFKALNNTKDRNEIKSILGKIKQHSKKSHQKFRSDC